LRRFPSAPVLLLLALLADVAAAAPLRPELRATISSAEAGRIPPEPFVPAAAPVGPRLGRTWTGHPRLLILLLDFDDRPADRDQYGFQHFETLLFSRGEMEYGSARDWYLGASYGRIDLGGEVRGWFRMPLTYAEYAGTTSGLCGSCFPDNARGLATHAVEAAEAAGIDFTRFDNDGPDGIPGSGDDDGILDGLVLVVPGYGAERTGQPTDLRSHYWDLPTRLSVGGVAVPDYLLVPEQENMGVAVHEIGHLLGADDLYDVSGRGAGLGNFSVMAVAMWFNDARQPGGPDPLTRIQWGILDPHAPLTDEPLQEIPCVLDEPFALRLWTEGMGGPEYFLVENRCPRGIDTLLVGEGLLLYHVDETQLRQNNPDRYRISVVQADGLHSLEGQTPRNSGEPGDFFPGLLGVREIDDGTLPSTRAYDGSPTRVALRSIGDPGAVMTASVEVGRYIGGGPHPRLLLEPPGGLLHGRLTEGETSPVHIGIRNLGTRLPGGVLRLFSRDPRVRVEGGVREFPVGDLDALREVDVGELQVEILPGDPSTRYPVLPLEAELSTAGRTYPLTAPLPVASNIVIQDGFETESNLVRAMPLLEGKNAWLHSGLIVREGKRAWTTATFPALANAALVVGPFSAGGITELRFQHRMSTLAIGNDAFDGGFLEVSRDGGDTWELLTPEGGYPYLFGFSSGNAYGGKPAWGGIQDWQEVVAYLPGDEAGSGDFLLRFHFVSDFSGYAETFQGWTIDALVIRTWQRAVAGIFGDPVVEEGAEQIPWHIVPALDHAERGRVRLLRESGSEHEVLGTWEYDGPLDVTTAVENVPPGRVDRFWLEWDDAVGGRSGPLVVLAPGQAPPVLLGATPALLRAGDAGRLRFRVPGSEVQHVTLDLFDVRGARVARLVDEEEIPGLHEIPWPARTEAGGEPASGVYFLRFRGDGFSETRRVVVLP